MSEPPPLLALPPRYTEDSVSLWRAAIRAGWDVERLHHWQVPPVLRDRDVKVYGESFFCRFVAEELGLSLVEPTLDWLPGLARQYLQREVRALLPMDAPEVPGPVFLKPADEKLFPAAVLADLSVPLSPAVVLDVGRIAGRGWAVVEANPAWGAGIYGCNPARILDVLAHSCRRLPL